MKASQLINQLNELIREYGDREIYSECDWTFVHSVEVGTDQLDLCVVAPIDTPDRMGEYKPVDVFVLTG